MSPGRLYDYVLKITSAEGLDSSDGSSDDEAVNVVSALVRVDGLQVHDVPDDVVFVAHAVAAQHVSSRPRDVQSLAAVVAFQNRNLKDFLSFQ